ncbi:MAG: Serine/threonine protein kinase [Myxococcaceae bacterium]|nr:Serine/threonine protein kinase [Myxococcaceae bacterium]
MRYNPRVSAVGLSLWLCLSWVCTARAEGARLALIIGNNVGGAHEPHLRYAEDDAERVSAALRDLGGFAPADTVMLRGENADMVRSTLITLNDRLRSIGSKQTVLLVYYSGHADAESMHLGESRLRFDELAKLVRGSSAGLRLLVVDACRSGVLTRVKGGRPVPPFALPEPEPTAPGEGFALLTASTANEDAQESDELGASFFTHAFVSGLRGAADENGDGRIMLDEVYRHTYEATLRASSQSAHGTQHPTFQYEVRGREAIVLTMLAGARDGQGRVTLPAGVSFVLLKGSAHGPVVAEVSERAFARTLTLPSGPYFVRGRAPDHLLEGKLELTRNGASTLRVDSLSKVAYARLVRKGGTEARLAHGVFALATVRSAIAGADRPCVGAAAGYALHFHYISVLPRADACVSGFRTRSLVASTREYALGVTAMLTHDVGRFAFSIGLALAVQLTRQSFNTRGEARRRLSTAPASALVAAFGVDAGAGIQLGLEARGETYLLHLLDSPAPHWEAAFAVRGGVSVSKLF